MPIVLWFQAQADDEPEKTICYADDDLILGCDHPDMNNTGVLGVFGNHARLFIEAGRWRIEDCNTGTGTFLNGNRLLVGESYLLRPNDHIRMGHFGVMVVALEVPGRWYQYEID